MMDTLTFLISFMVLKTSFSMGCELCGLESDN
jgi:hypothetical protein